MIFEDLDLAIAAAGAGAAVVRARFGQPLERLAKSANDFATTADIEAERIIVETIRATRPDDAVVGEESGRGGSGYGGRTWLVDPLCGTLNFAARTPLAAVNVVTGGDLRDSVHFAAGIALCQAAGCVVTDLRGRPVYSGAGGLIAAADRDTHARLSALVARQFATTVQSRTSSRSSERTGKC